MKLILCISNATNLFLNQSLKGLKVLDAECGTGYGSAFLVDQGIGSLVAVDIAAEALDIGRKFFNRENIVWSKDDCHTLQEASKYGPFDVICNLENLEHLQEPERFLDRCRQMLKPDGIFITSVPNKILSKKMSGVNQLKYFINHVQ